ncbi:MAG TPA: hypothetical protein DDZ84_04625 [Firmicutes bacterium]|jgi:hypothetical protein|nr:hypothetical protein [Bacillota bacterium]
MNRAVIVVATAATLLCAGCLGRSALRDEVMSYFPANEGFTWVYTGFAEYGHKMSIDRITSTESPGNVVYEISGAVFDMSDGESERDFSLRLEYVFTQEDVRERILHKDVFPHRIDGLIMLRAPIKEGQKWSFEAQDGSRVDAAVTGMGKDPQDDLAYCEVEYTIPDPSMPDGVYRETRVLKKGLGVVAFKSTILPDVEFNYSLLSTSRSR